MDQTIRLDAKKRESSFCEEKIYPMRRGERNNVVLDKAEEPSDEEVPA